MHIHTAVSHLVALSNMFRCANKHVLLVENVQCHNFVDDILALRDGGHLTWQDMQLHVFERNGARAILASNQTLDLPTLISDDQIREGCNPRDADLSVPLMTVLEGFMVLSLIIKLHDILGFLPTNPAFCTRS